MVWGLPKTSHQFAAAAKQFTLDIVNFHRSSAQKKKASEPKTAENQNHKKGWKEWEKKTGCGRGNGQTSWPSKKNMSI